MANRLRCIHCGNRVEDIYISCANCKKQFLGRKDARFCGDTCSKAFRRRKKKECIEYKRHAAPFDYWKPLRDRVVKFYGAKCMRCGSLDKINVDHIKPKWKYPELEMDINNLQVLCWPCNALKGGYDETDYRPIERLK